MDSVEVGSAQTTFDPEQASVEEILGAITREIRSVVEDMTLRPEERRARLQQLAENDIRLLHEQDELEKRQVELFGLRDQQLDINVL